jgi:two-component system heavy metal sensor histidine kinase CusS
MSRVRPIAVRMGAMFALAALLVFCVLGYVLDRELAMVLRRQQTEQLAIKFEDIDYVLKRLRTPDQWVRIHAKLDALTPADHSTQYWVLSRDPVASYGTPPPEIVAFSHQAPRTGPVFVAGRSEPMLVQTAFFPANDRHDDLWFTVGVDSGSYVRTRREFGSVLLLSVSVVVVLFAALGYLITYLGLVPLRRLSRQAQALSPSALSQRLVVERLPAELFQLAQSFNGALDRLEAAYQQLESFTADVAHELRTPLTNLIGQTQVALSRRRTTEQLVDVLASNLEDLERLRSIVNDMLFLARASQGERSAQLKQVPLAAEVQRAVEFLDFLSEDAGVSLRIQGDANAAVERALFGRAITNLLDNALHHARAQTEIVVDLTEAGGYARIAVSNVGADIPPEHLVRLFDRFYRVDSARSSSRGGHGLGLAIVKAIATMHGGNVFAHSHDGMTTIGFCVALGADASARGLGPEPRTGA